MSLRDEAVGLLQAADPPEHGQPAGERDRSRPSSCATTSSPSASSASCTRASPSGPTWSRAFGAAATGPSLLLLSHTDTVLADPAEWRLDPWSGELRDGEVWGRGALDMKSQVAANAVAIASLAREGFRPTGDLIFAATADEEMGEGVAYGLEWLCEAHPDAVRCDYAVNEGGGDRVEIGGRVLYLCASAEKRSSPVRAARARAQRPWLDARRSPTTRSSRRRA